MAELPSEETLVSNYRDMIRVYQEIVESPLSPEISDLLEEPIEKPKSNNLEPTATEFVPRPKKKSGHESARHEAGESDDQRNGEQRQWRHVLEGPEINPHLGAVSDGKHDDEKRHRHHDDPREDAHFQDPNLVLRTAVRGRVRSF